MLLSTLRRRLPLSGENALWYKLLNNINGKVCNAILNMYNDVKYCINYNNCKSAYISCDMGVRQGENLPSFLFAFVLNDLQSFLENENLSGLRDRPFDLQGGVWFFVSFRNIFSDTQELEYFFFLSRYARIFVLNNLTLLF